MKDGEAEPGPNTEKPSRAGRARRIFAAGPQGEMARSVLAREIRYGRVRYREIGRTVLPNETASTEKPEEP